MDNRLALQKSYGPHLEAVCALITSKGSFKPVGRLRVAGCKTRVAIAKVTALQRAEKPPHYCARDRNLARSNEKLQLAIAVVPDHFISRPM